MSRPRTKGDLIQFRLPVALHNELARLAKARRETPSEYVARNMERSLTLGMRIDRGAAATPKPAVPSPQVTAGRATREPPRTLPVHAETCTCATCKPRRES